MVIKKSICFFIFLFCGLYTQSCFSQDESKEINGRESEMEQLVLSFKTNFGRSKFMQETNNSDNVSSVFKQVFAYSYGSYAKYRLYKLLSLESGIEYRNLGYKLESTFGGLLRTVDFKQNIRYKLHYISIPVSIGFNFFKHTCHVYGGVVFNISVGGSMYYDYDYEHSSISVTNDNSKTKIDNLQPYCTSLRSGVDVMFSNHWGFSTNFDYFISDVFINFYERRSIMTTAYLGLLFWF